jgi:transcriptional regulator with XRE-family HTH domain
MIPGRDNPDLGNQIRRHRERAKLTRFQLAEKLGCSDAFIAMIERGKGRPGPDIYNGLVEIFNHPEVAEPATRVPFNERAQAAAILHEQDGILRQQQEAREVTALRELTARASEVLSLETLIQMIVEKGYEVTVTKRTSS